MKKLRSWIRKQERFLTKYRWLIIGIAIIAGITILFFGTKIYLLLNFLLGNDIVVKLDTNTTSVQLSRGQQADILFTAGVITNPFCSAECTATWYDKSSGALKDTQAFKLSPGVPYQKTYTIEANRYGSGQELYQFTMQCKSTRTVLCHTTEIPTRRTVLVTHDYTPSQNEQEALASLQTLLPDLLGGVASYEELVHERTALLSIVNAVLVTNMSSFDVAFSLDEMALLWGEARYEDTLLLAKQTAELLEEATRVLTSSVEELQDALSAYNQHVAMFNEAGDVLQAFGGKSMNSTIAQHMNETIHAYNQATIVLSQQASLDEKRTLIRSIVDNVASTTAQAQAGEDRETMWLALQLDMVADASCQIGGPCVSHDTLSSRVNSIPNTQATCDRVVPGTTSRPDDVNILQNMTNAYVQAIPNGTYTSLIRDLLVERPITNVTNATLSGLRGLISPCVFYDLEQVVPEQMTFLNGTITVSVPVPVWAPPPDPACCVDGLCTACCEDCSDSFLPVMFIHGHAFNKGTLADFSLDAFNSLQEKLEEDGYIDAGSISLYTTTDTPPGSWGRTPTPISVRASYYFDVFKEPENYVVVQTKSENIDTYAVRLKELIDIVLYKTGKDQVIIVAHSMGGLVTRRYAHVFGEEVLARVIFLTVPNHGIAGNVADYCNVLGERLECRDMNTNSLFINKLQRAPPLRVPVDNIIGTGCDMNGKQGDGVVLAENAYLKGATNHYVTGSCTTLETLHTEILDTTAYPGVYEIVQDALSES